MVIIPFPTWFSNLQRTSSSRLDSCYWCWGCASAPRLSDRKERNSKEHPPYKELFCQNTYYLVFSPHYVFQWFPNDSVKVQCLCLDSWLNLRLSQGLDLAHVGLWTELYLIFIMLFDLPLGWVELRARDRSDISSEGKGIFELCD